MEIETDLAYSHSHLIDLFLDANHLKARTVAYDQEIDQVKHPCIKIIIDDVDSELALTAMGIRNYGVKNMLDHFLLKCGVAVNDLHPRHYKDGFRRAPGPFML